MTDFPEKNLIEEETKYSEQEFNEYKQKVRNATNTLIDLGVLDQEWTNVADGISLLEEKLRQREIAVYGKERTQEQIQEEIDQSDKEIKELDQKIANNDEKIAKYRIALAMKQFKKSA
jgi:chromosome segregation ATPase